LLDIATQHASGEEAVGATFTLAEASMAASGGRITPPNITVQGMKKGAKGGKKGQKCRPRHLAAMVNNGNIGVKIKNFDKEFMAVAKHDFKRCTRPPIENFEKIVEVTCPHDPYPIKNKLMDCAMMKRFMSSAGTPPDSDELARDPRGRGTMLKEVEVTTIAG
jgi:hypothetical protein